MIIELVGLPASGKSFLARKILEQRGGQLSSARPLCVRDGVCGVVRFPVVFSVLLVSAIRSGWPRGMWYQIKCFVLARIAELGRAWRAGRNSLQVLDEGPLQALLSIDAVNERLVVAMLRRTPATHIVLFMIDENVRCARLRGRPYVLRPHLSEAERAEWEHAVEEWYATLAVFVKNDPRTFVIESEEDVAKFLKHLSCQR